MALQVDASASDNAEWGRRYLDSLPTSPHRDGDTAPFVFAGSCSTGWRQTVQWVTVHRGDVIDGEVVRLPGDER